uniref:Uncharacterized protein n=1 Tax=Setaria italica TaxID=4555 RepID=K3ZBC8_SETIT
MKHTVTLYFTLADAIYRTGRMSNCKQKSQTMLFFNEHGHTELDIDRQMYALISKSKRHRIFISVKMETLSQNSCWNCVL